MMTATDQAVSGRDYLLGPELTGADVQMSFVGEIGRAFGNTTES